jgi:hypothetical protein
MTHWFKQKRYGYGAVPSTWQGWAVTGIYLVALLALTAWLTEGALQEQSRHLPFLAMVTVLTIFLVAVVTVKTEGGLRWRWGDDDKR